MYWHKIEQPGIRSVCFYLLWLSKTNCNCHLNSFFLTLLYVDNHLQISLQFVVSLSRLNERFGNKHLASDLPTHAKQKNFSSK